MSKSGLHLDRTLAIVSQLRSRIDGCIAMAVKDRLTHQYILDRRHRETFDHPMWARLPHWAQRDVNAYFHGKVDMVGRYHTVFAYRAIEDGKLYQASTGWIRAPYMELWDVLLARHGKFDDTMWSENGDYWPCGRPFSVYPNGYRKPETSAT